MDCDVLQGDAELVELLLRRPGYLPYRRWFSIMDVAQARDRPHTDVVPAKTSKKRPVVDTFIKHAGRHDMYLNCAWFPDERKSRRIYLRLTALGCNLEYRGLGRVQGTELHAHDVCGPFVGTPTIDLWIGPGAGRSN